MGFPSFLFSTCGVSFCCFVSMLSESAGERERIWIYHLKDRPSIQYLFQKSFSAAYGSCYGGSAVGWTEHYTERSLTETCDLSIILCSQFLMNHSHWAEMFHFALSLQLYVPSSLLILNAVAHRQHGESPPSEKDHVFVAAWAVSFLNITGLLQQQSDLNQVAWYKTKITVAFAYDPGCL